MKNLSRLALTLIFALLAVSFAAAGPAAAPAAAKDQVTIDFAGPVAVIDLKDLLTPYNAPAAKENDGSRWYLLSATNGSVRPVTRVLMAADPPGAVLHIFPRPARPEVEQVASSDSGVAVERLPAVGRHAFIVTVPPATSVSLAVRVGYGDEKPSIQAWSEPALVAHNRQVAIFFAAVAGLIAAAMVIMAGVAIITAHPAPGWAAAVLFLIFLTRLHGAGVLDAGWMTKVGGPYGLGAMLAGLTLAATLRLTDFVAPLTGVWPSAARWRYLLLFVVAAISVAAFIGVPATAVVTYGLVVGGSALIAVYLVTRGLRGSKAARVVAPSAAVFSLVAAAGAAAAFGVFPQNPMASGIIAGFTAAGSVLLALAIAAGEGIAILPLARDQGAAGAVAISSRPDVAGAQAIGASHQGVFDLDFTRGRLRLSREATRILGMKSGKTVTHDDWIARIHPDDRQVYVDAMKEYRTHPGLAFRMEFRVSDAVGREPWLELRATVFGKGKIGRRCLGLIADISTRKVSELTTGQRTLTDRLTGLGNRIGLLEELETMEGGWPHLAFAILDIDRFKTVHASLGDAGGDQLLASLAARIAGKFATGTSAFRIGGDSFAVLVPNAADYCARLGAELIDLCNAPFSIGGRNVFTSASAGAVAGRDAGDPLELIKDAELALTLAKRQGGGCWKVFAPEMENFARGDAVALETDLRRGLNANEFTVYYQPIIHLADGSVSGFEALLRWRHPERGLISPAEFIAHSEETGLIVALGRFALERTASDLADWQRYFPIEPPLFASVNVSRRQLREENFATSIEKLLAAGNFQNRSFKLEVTESAIEMESEARRILVRLRAAGAGLAIDDFGTGLSTLSELKDLPFDTVKIDRSFLSRRAGAQQESDAAAVITSVVSLAHELNRTVIVEGVETERDALWLRQLGCEFAQGFHFSPPLAPDDALKFIASHFQATAPQRQQRREERTVSSGASGVG